MWSILNGTLVNAATVAVGSTGGLLIAGRLPPRYQQIILSCLGLVTITLGVDSAVLVFADTAEKFGPLVGAPRTYGARLAMVMIASLLIGAIIGTMLRLHDRIEGAGVWIHRRVSSGDGKSFAEGFLTASVIFCVGPLTLLGCLENGAHANPSLLYIKAVLDGFCSLALASAFGAGVLASLITIVVFQGGLSLLAYQVAEPLDEVSVALMTVVGGILLLATALMLLDIKKIPVADMLPGVLLPPLFVWIIENVSPGLLLPPG
jgi:hypothetical protein